MKLRFIKKSPRNKLICERSDGSTEILSLGEQMPSHDLAHYVVESRLNLKNGFYGNIANGYTLAQLEQTEFIRTLSPETMISEVLTRALQSLYSGACKIDEFVGLVDAEIKPVMPDYNLILSNENVQEMLVHFQDLIIQWKALKDGEEMILFPLK